MRACVIGAGAFGTALANVLAVSCEEVQLWARDAEVVAEVAQHHQNSHYLPGIPLSPRIAPTLNLEEAVRGAEVVVCAAPSHAHREVMSRAAPHLADGAVIVTVAKGIENDSLMTMTEVLEQVLPEARHPYIAVLSGPSFAKELAAGFPTVVTVASRWEKTSKKCQAIFQTETFRSYTSTDVVGVQLGGALKNVIAIGAGMSDGLGFGHNARAALITRGLAEITRMAVKLGGNPLTLAGLAGLGDLVLTCTGELSRNRRVGFELGQGKSLQEILSGMHQVAEGVKTARSAKDLVQKTGVELPICEQIYAIAHEGKPARQAFIELMSRQPKSEL